MPAIASGKVLVTGANGYIAAWIVKYFLEAGFSVRGTVRDVSKGAHLMDVFSSYGDKLEFVAVEDMTQDDAFYAAAAAVDAIVHTASPVNLDADDPNEEIEPAVRGTLSALRAAAHTPSVRRVVTVSSFAAVVDRAATGARVYDESMWNDADLAKYAASKVHAERAAWAYFRAAKAEAEATGEELRWDLAVVVPPWVFGPTIHEVRGGPETLNGSNLYLHKVVFEGVMLGKPWEDWGLAAGKFSSKAHSVSPTYDPSATYETRINSNRAREVIGMTKYHSIEETMKDIIADYAARGSSYSSFSSRDVYKSTIGPHARTLLRLSKPSRTLRGNSKQEACTDR
ncbi:NAD-P-binding protein [Epithele typhae]|uniref:NAD-P-binding protein n=1 Tax=Epithele typhae TaxID=378194 RepID=UPI002008B429|nr:NAD-P-binding protein [Epithele typhae]KAH9918740.1 NAD-P-binding protein [Epithele typhae]